MLRKTRRRIAWLEYRLELAEDVIAAMHDRRSGKAVPPIPSKPTGLSEYIIPKTAQDVVDHNLSVMARMMEDYK